MSNDHHEKSGTELGHDMNRFGREMAQFGKDANTACNTCAATLTSITRMQDRIGESVKTIAQMCAECGGPDVPPEEESLTPEDAPSSPVPHE